MLHDVRRAGLGAVCRILPEVADPSAHLAAATVVVSTSREDPFPLSLLEAAALGTPVVAFDSGGFGELLAGCGRSGWVVEQGDVLGLCAQVLRLIEDPDLAHAEALQVQRSRASEDIWSSSAAPTAWPAIKGGRT